MRTTTSRVVPALTLATALLLTACGGSDSTAGTTAAPSAGTTASAPATAGLVIEDSWVKASPEGMTALFGVLRNTGATDVTVVSGSTDVAETVELHEVVMSGGAMKMQPKEGGFVVPAGGTHELKPGGDHVMIMGLKTPVAAGDPVTVTLTTATGERLVVDTVAKDFTGANESYQPTPMASMSGSATP